MSATIHRKSSKPIACRYFPSIPGRGTLEIGRGKSTDCYIVAEIASDPDGAPGRTFRLRKCGPEEAIYDCHVASDSAYSSCDCAAVTFETDGSEACHCKHVVAMTRVLESGAIDAEDPEFPSETATPPVAAVPVVVLPMPAPKFDSVSLPAVLTLACPICGETAEARPLRCGRFTHTFHCQSCLDRAERSDDW